MADAAARKASIESRRKAIERITEKKRANQSKQSRASLEEQLEQNRFRLKWKSDMVGKRRERLNTQVDEEILKKTIKTGASFLDFSKLDVINPLAGLDLELKDEPQFDIEPRPLDIMITLTKDSNNKTVNHDAMTAMSSGGHDMELSAPRRNSITANDDVESKVGKDVDNTSSSALLHKFNRKISKRMSPLGEYLRNATSPSEQTSPSALQAISKDTVTSDQGGHANLASISGKGSLPDQSDRLVDNVFVVGPGIQDLDPHVNQYMNSLGNLYGNDAMSYTSDTKSINTTKTQIQSPVEKLKRTQSGKKLIDIKTEKLPPRLLYSFCSMDSEIEELCFPSKVEVTISLKSVSRRNSETKRVENPSYANTCFVFKLTGHTSSRFVICLPLRKTFTDERGVEIATSYCICIISRFAFFSYFTHVLQQFVDLGGLDFESPLEKQDVGFPIVSKLKYLNDMANKMYRVIVPLYPIATKSEENADIMNRSLPPVEVQIAVKSVIPSAPSRKLDIVLRRDLQLKFFSNQSFYTGGTMSQSNDNNEKNRDLEREESFYVLLWGLPVLLRMLPLDQISLAIGCALIEMHLIVLSPDVATMSACLLTIVHLLRPLKWVGVVVVTLPESQSEYLDSPVPLIAGVQALPPGFQLSPGVVVLDCQENCVKFHPVDNVASHKFFLPQTNKLIHSLTAPAETIYRLTRRKSISMRKRSTSVSIMDMNTMSLDGEIDKEKLPLPLSVDMDPVSDKGQQLMSAVSAFSSTVASHLQVIVNTAVQTAWLEKQSKYKKRELKLSPTKGPASTDKVINSKLFNDIVRTSSASVLNARQAFGGRSLPASVATAAATMRLNPKTWMTTMANIVGGGDMGDGTLSVASSTQDSKGSGLGSDSSESLPSIQKGAPFFPSKEIGETGMTFIKSLQGTQMFCIYCQNRRQRSKQMRDQLETNTIDSSLDDSDGDMPLNVNDVSIGSYSEEKTNTAAVDALTSPLGSSKDLVSKEVIMSPLTIDSAIDPLVVFFQIVMFGSVPIPIHTLQAVKLAYAHNEASLDPLTHPGDALYPPISDIEKEIYWCNGRCGGAANTETCTTLCLQLWEERVKLFTHHLAIKEIVERNHHSNIVLSPVRLGNGDLISIKPSIVPIRHSKETESQYHQRVQLVEKTRLEETLKADDDYEEDDNPIPRLNIPIDGRHAYLPLSVTQKSDRMDWASPLSAVHKTSHGQSNLMGEYSDQVKNKKPLHPDTVYWQSQRGSKKRTIYARHNASSSVKSIAKYYVRMQKNRVVNKVTTAARIVTSFLYHTHFLLYKWQRFAAASIIQGLFRGTFIRRCMPTIKQELIAEKELRNHAATLIQHWGKDCIARQNAAREKLLTFQRLNSSRSPTIIPISSGEYSVKGRSKSLWSPPTFVPQPPPGGSPLLNSPVQLPGDHNYPEFPFVGSSSSYDLPSISRTTDSIYGNNMNQGVPPISSRPSMVADSLLQKTKSKGFGSKAKIIFKGFLGKGAASVDKPSSENQINKGIKSAPAPILKAAAATAQNSIPFASGNQQNNPSGSENSGPSKTYSKFSVHSDDEFNECGQRDVSLAPIAKDKDSDIASLQKQRVVNNISPQAIAPVPKRGNGAVSPMPETSDLPVFTDAKHVRPAGTSAFSEALSQAKKPGGDYPASPNNDYSTSRYQSPSKKSPGTADSKKSQRNRVSIASASDDLLDSEESAATTTNKSVHYGIIPEMSQTFDQDDVRPNFFSDFTFNATGGLQLASSIPQPLHKLFVTAGDAFTRQQRTIILDMYAELKHGVDIIKHGRGGKAHQRFLFTDDTLSVLFWRTTADAHKETEFHHTKHGRRFSFFGGKQDDDRFVCIQDILRVSDVLETVIPNRRSSAAKAATSTEPRIPLSLHCADSSLEMELFEKDWAKVYYGIDVLVNYYNRTRLAESLDASARNIPTSVDDSRVSTAPNAATTGHSSKKTENRRHSIV